MPFRALDSPLAAPLAWGLLAAAAGIAAAPLEPSLLEEGVVVHIAERMLAGEHLYRDVIIHTGLLPYELLAFLFRVFGPEIAVERAAVVVLQAVATALVFALARRGGARALAHSAAAAVAAAPVLLFPLFSIFFYTTLAFYLSLIASYAGVRGTRSSGWAVAAGALLTCVALCKQTTGTILAVSSLAAVVLGAAPGTRVARAAAVIAGGVTAALLVLALYVVRGDLGALLFCLVELPLSIGDAFRAPFINLWPPGVLDPAVRESWVTYLPSFYHLKYGLFVEIGKTIVVATQLLYALPFVALGGTLIRAIAAPLPAACWIHAAVLLAMTLNLFPRSSWGHLVVALPPAVVQLVLLFPSGGEGARSSRVRRFAAAGLALLLSGGAGTTALWLHRISGPPTFGPRVPLRPVSRALRGTAIPRVIHYLREHAPPGEAIFVPRQEPLIYFATRMRNPTPFVGVLPGLRELQEPVILDVLREVRFVVMSDIDQPLYVYYSDELPGVQARLERHFQIPRDFPVGDYSWILVLRRGRDRGATAIDLVEERPRARPWVRDRDGVEHPAPNEPPRLVARQLRRPLPVVLGAGGGGIDYELDIPEGAVFQAGVGFRSLLSVDTQHLHPPGITLAVAIRTSRDFQTLAAVRVNDDIRAGRRWTPVEVELSDYAGQRVTLRLEADAKWPIEPGNLSWWGSPRIALRPGAD